MKRRWMPSALIGATLVLVPTGCAPANAVEVDAIVQREILADRFSAGRFTGQQVWHPCAIQDTTALIVVAQCGEVGVAADARVAKIAELSRRGRARGGIDSSAQGFQTRALIDLRFGGPARGAVDRAIAALEAGVALDPRNPALLNDLALAYLAAGERDQKVRPVLRALDAIERAFEADSTSRAVLFNRALIRERLYLLQTGRSAWSRSARGDANAAWRREAEQHADALQARLDGSVTSTDSAARALTPQTARDAAIAALGAWGSAILRGDTVTAGRALAVARARGRMLDSIGADSSISLACATIDRMSGDRRLAQLAEGHIALAQGVALHSRAAFDDAAVMLGRAESRLRALRSPMAPWAIYYRGAAEIFRGDYAVADARLSAVSADATAPPAAVGKAIAGLGVSQLRRGAYENANRYYARARPYFVRAREPEGVGTIAFLRAESFVLGGQGAAADGEALRGLRALSPFRHSPYLTNHLISVASLARLDGLPRAALAVMDEALGIGRSLGRPQIIAFASIARGRDLTALGRRAEAALAFETAMRSTDSLNPGSGRDRVRADAQLGLADLTRSSGQRTAVVTLSSAADVYRHLKTDGYLATALYQRALVLCATGDSVAARRDLSDAIAAIDRQNHSTQSADARATLIETVEEVYDMMIGLELAARRPDSAFSYLERGRAAVWSATGDASASRSRSAVPSLGALSARLSPDAVFIEYAVLRDRVVLWSASRGAWEQTTVPMPRDSIAGLVSAFLRDAHDSRGGGQGASRRLFDLLLQPVLAHRRWARQLVVVADRELSLIPFTALWSDDAHGYVLEQYHVRTLPTAAFAIGAMSRVSRGGDGTLIVGDPALSATLTDLLPLPGAAREADSIATFYPRAMTLSGASARRERVMELLPRSRVFHFAGHAVTDAGQPERSYLALAAVDAFDDGSLRAREISNLSLSNVELVVLSACSTSNPRSSRVGGVSGLASSFLRAGAAATISTLWDVDDDATSAILIAFHRRFSKGASAEEALRLAQLDAVHSPRAALRSPRTWAPFVYTGP